MPASKTFSKGSSFSARLKLLRRQRRQRVELTRATGKRRSVLRPTERIEVLRKAGSRCHICGGSIKGDDWHADHVLAHSTGGARLVDNYLPSHAICNNYRWF